jgi:uncharacterized membrane protein YdbT with pleckstrin-like domain
MEIFIAVLLKILSIVLMIVFIASVALLIISTATVWGTNGNIMMRYFQARGSLQPQQEQYTHPMSHLWV